MDSFFSNNTNLLIERYCNRWSMMVLLSLEAAGDTNLRHKEIKERCGSTSDKMLDKALTELCDDGLVKKNFYPDNPHRPDYKITERGKSFLVTLHQMLEWASMNQKEILADRQENLERREKYDK